MGATPLALELLLLLLVTVALLHKYGSWSKQRTAVSLATLLGWYFSFIIIFVLPLDIAITFYRRCLVESSYVSNSTSSTTSAPVNLSSKCSEPRGYVPDDVLLNLWRVVYWTAQILTWLLLPLMQSYVTAGEFTMGGRFRCALVNNVIYYSIYFVVFVLLVFYALLKGIVINAEHLKVILVSASNTWGLFLLVVLLGYGLVEVPRQLWCMGRRDYSLNKVYFKIDQMSTEKADAEDVFREVYKEARGVLNALKNEHGAREKAQLITARFSDSAISQLFPSRSGADFASLSPASTLQVNNDKYLVRLHQRAIQAVQTYHRTAAQWDVLISRALWLESVQQAELTGTLPTLPPPFSLLPPSIVFFCLITARRPLAKIMAVVLCSSTVFILLSECTFFIVNPTLSPAALFLQYAARNFHYTYTQVAAILLITFLSGCAYFTVFRLRIYKYYNLDPNHLTDENSLLFSAILLCRLTPPICLNLLGLVHLDSHISNTKNFGVETQFTKLMGHLDLLPILAKGINIYLPLLILLFCALTYYKLGTRLMHAVGIEQFIDSDEVTRDAVSAGKALVTLERNKRSRREERQKKNSSPTAPFSSLAGRIRGASSRVFESSSVFSEERQPIVTEEEPVAVEARGTSRAGPNPVALEAGGIERAGTNPFSSVSGQGHPNSINFFDDM